MTTVALQVNARKQSDRFHRANWNRRIRIGISGAEGGQRSCARLKRESEKTIVPESPRDRGSAHGRMAATNVALKVSGAAPETLKPSFTVGSHRTNFAGCVPNLKPQWPCNSNFIELRLLPDGLRWDQTRIAVAPLRRQPQAAGPDRHAF